MNTEKSYKKHQSTKQKDKNFQSEKGNWNNKINKEHLGTTQKEKIQLERGNFALVFAIAGVKI